MNVLSRRLDRLESKLPPPREFIIGVRIGETETEALLRYGREHPNDPALNVVESADVLFVKRVVVHPAGKANVVPIKGEPGRLK